jgi:hypothetical protein
MFDAELKPFDLFNFNEIWEFLQGRWMNDSSEK